jgi:carnitine monooxygenase subunit
MDNSSPATVIDRPAKAIFSCDAQTSATLPARYYYDPEIYERERDAVWFKTWQFVGVLEHLSEPGSYITADILDQKVFVVRGKDNQLRAFYNVCQHRAHILLQGRGKRALVVCPFHAWSYQLDGTLKSSLQTRSVRAFDPSDYALTEIRVDTLGFMVFVNLDPDALPLEHYAAELLEQFRTAIPGFEHLRVVREDVFDVKANWKFVMDGMECYHCPTIHPQVMGGAASYLTKNWDSSFTTYHSQHFTAGKSDLEDKLPYKVEELAIRDGYVWFCWPNLIFIARPGPSNIQVIATQPISVESSRRQAVTLCVNVPPTEFDLGHMDFWRDVLWPQDREAMEQQQAGIRSKGYRQGRVMVDPVGSSWWSEEGTHHFDNLLWQALNGDDYQTDVDA